MSQDLPQTLGRYQLTDKIGTGAMGVVYKGLDPLIGRPVALKLVRTDLLDEADRDGYRARFRQEVRSAGRCVHPGIVTVYDYAERDGDPYIVMEYVEGPTLQRLLSGRKLPLPQVVDFTLQLLAALGHAHEQGIVHRDIKPANIIVGPGSRLRITDFGIARMDASALTNAGTLLGTPSYMAPEQARGERVDHRADLFAVGMVFLRMLTGSLPYADDSFAAILYKMATKDPIDETEPRLGAVASLALAKDPAQRFQTAYEFEHMLRAMTVEQTDAEIWPGMSAEAPTAPAAAPPVEASWTDDQLIRLRLALAESVGPIAMLLVTKAAPLSVSPWDLVDRLGRSIANEAARTKFLTACHAIVGVEAEPPPEVPAVLAAVLPAEPFVLPLEVISGAQSLLARSIGPMARILVRQGSLNVLSFEEFGDRLASHIGRESEKLQFKRDLSRLFDQNKPR